MATPLDNRPRPSLKPLWTPYYDLRGSPRSPLRSARAYAFTPSPRSPKTLPTPVYPLGPHDGTMRQHERTMVDRLDPMVRHAKKDPDVSPPGSTPASRPLSPIPASHRGNGRRQAQSLPAPPTPADSFPRRQTLVAETRRMLLAGVAALDDLDRRQSVPNFRPPGQSRRARETLHLEQLRAWGHVYLGDAATADVFVTAVAARRPSESSTTSSSSSSSPASASSSSSPSAEPSSTDETKPKHTLGNRPGPTTIRARVRPRDLDRKPFLIQREFDLEELRATVPDPLPRAATSTPAPKAPAGGRRRLSVVEPPNPPYALRPLRARRRSSSAKSGLLPSGHGLRSGSNRDARASTRGSSAMPIHLEYARAHLPVLAALILSGHIREGDVIDLPLPHPEAWPQTVAYVYTGQGEWTDAIKENILHLAGKA